MPKLLDIAIQLISPIHFMFLSACYIPGTVIALLFSLNISTLLSISKFKEAWFARFWADYGPDAREGAPDNAKPFIKQAYGVVLEIGPGNGGWVGDYDKEKVTKIYGVEPNKDHHTKLRQKVIEAGLGDIYVICGVGVEDLGERWVKRGDVDCVVTIQCLCSVPNPNEIIFELYNYLKEGGKWIVYEHVITRKGYWISKYQAIIDLIWPTFLGGCSITRDTEKWLRDAGDWAVIDLKQPDWEPYYEYQVLPHVMGTLQK